MEMLYKPFFGVRRRGGACGNLIENLLIQRMYL